MIMLNKINLCLIICKYYGVRFESDENINKIIDIIVFL